MTVARSNRVDVRNPIMGLEEVRALIAAASPEARQLLSDICKVVSKDLHARADKAWAKRKPPMAAYWRAQAVNARHISLAVRP